VLGFRRFNAIIDAWARSGDRIAPRRAEQILDHMDELFLAGNKGVKPDTYTYNTLINCWYVFELWIC
jgi:PPR repeat